MAEVEEGKLVRRTTIPVPVGQPTPADARKWLGQQVVYANFAGVNNGLDEIVTQFVQQTKASFYQRMVSVFERWETIWEAVNGDPPWGEYEDDIHVPETQKKFRQKMARIFEALNDFDPIFETEGTRGDLPRWKAQVIGSYVYRCMEMAGFRKLVQPVSGDMEITNVAAVKLQWNVTKGMVVDRKWSREEVGGKLVWKDERRMRDAVASGLKYRQVDPFRFIYDIDCGDLESDDCAYVGDESYQFLHELETAADNGLFSKKMLTLVRDRQSKKGDGKVKADQNPDMMPTTNRDYDDGSMPSTYRGSRNIAMSKMFQAGNGESSPGKVQCTELWAWFDFADGYTGIADPLGRKVTGVHKVVITTANGVPIQFRLNPFDKKFHPYAIGIINRNGHESVSPSNFEQVIQVNAQADGYKSNVLRHAHLSVAPVGIVQGEWPHGSLLGVKAGTVFPNVSGFQEVKISDLPRDVQFMDSMFRREVEETSGVLNVFESPQGTATETNRKVQEQQRAIRHSVIANGELWKQVARKSLWMLAQFSTGPERFKVSGKASKILGDHFEITPDILQEDADFRFLGPDNMHVFGDRQSGIMQWMSSWGPMLPAMPGFNLMGLARQHYELTVGRDHIQDIFPNDEPVWAAWPQDQENEMLLSGLHVPISIHDDDQEHIADMEILMKGLANRPAYVQKRILDHRMAHAIQAEKKAAEEKAQMKKAAQEQAVMGGRPGVDKAPTPGGMEAQGGGSGAQTPGVTPGPTQTRTVSKTGRQGSGLSQQQAMGGR